MQHLKLFEDFDSSSSLDFKIEFKIPQILTGDEIYPPLLEYEISIAIDLGIETSMLGLVQDFFEDLKNEDLAFMALKSGEFTSRWIGGSVPWLEQKSLKKDAIQEVAIGSIDFNDCMKNLLTNVWWSLWDHVKENNYKKENYFVRNLLEPLSITWTDSKDKINKDEINQIRPKK